VNDEQAQNIDLSVIIPVTERFDPVSELYYEYKRAVESTGKHYEFIYVLDGEYPDVLKELNQLQQSESIMIITLAKWFGEATALSAAFSKASGEVLLTLPAFKQIETDDIPALVAALHDYDCDMILARRWPRRDSLLNRRHG
jgi:hypothetical protein